MRFLIALLIPLVLTGCRSWDTIPKPAPAVEPGPPAAVVPKVPSCNNDEMKWKEDDKWVYIAREDLIAVLKHMTELGQFALDLEGEGSGKIQARVDKTIFYAWLRQTIDMHKVIKGLQKGEGARPADPAPEAPPEPEHSSGRVF